MTPCEIGLGEIDPISKQPKLYKYETLPKFDTNQYYKPRKIECYNNEEAASVHLKSLINND
jgi:hypothetical protein